MNEMPRRCGDPAPSGFDRVCGRIAGHNGSHRDETLRIVWGGRPNKDERKRERMIALASWYSGWCTDNESTLPELTKLGALLLGMRHQLAMDRPYDRLT